MLHRLFWIGSLIGVLFGCHYKDEAHRQVVLSSAERSRLAAASAAPVELAHERASGRVVAIGDLHGDLDAARRAFRLAGAIDSKDNWVGGSLVVVQTGDVLDRGDQDRALMEWLESMRRAAQAGGGRLRVLNGNHEVMNVLGDFRYVSAAGFLQFRDLASERQDPGLTKLPLEIRGRAAAFLPRGPYALLLSSHPTVLIVNDTVFAHGGVLAKHLRYGLVRINHEVEAWMRGDAPLPRALQGDDTPFWTRVYGESMTQDACDDLKKVLGRLGAVRMVVGHTPQKDGISLACDASLARIDVGMSAAYGDHPVQALEIDGPRIRVLTEQRPADM